MANIYVEAKGPIGPQAKESLLPTAVNGYERGLAVTYGADQYHATLIAAAAATAVGILEEDAINVNNPCSVVEFGQAVAQVGANVAALQPLTTNAEGQLVPAQPGQPVVAIALEPQVYVSPGSFATVFVLGLFGFTQLGGNGGDAVTYIAASGAIPVVSGTYVINGAAALAMTLATPTAAQDGTRLVLVAGTSHAHTVTTAADVIEGTKDTITFAAAYDICILEAVNLKYAVQFIGGPTPAALSEV
jgi:hypothetical protein